MTDLSALKQTVRRYRELRRTCKSPFPAHAESHFIADALLSTEPITRTALEELGWKADTDDDLLFVAGNRKIWFIPERAGTDRAFEAFDGERYYTPWEPAPKHLGALLSLLLWLEEQK